MSSCVPSVVTVHDLIFLRCPQYYKPVDRRLYDYKYGAACRNADRIISISDGVITECGTHDELLRKGGIYAELYKTQNALALEPLGQ